MPNRFTKGPDGVDEINEKDDKKDLQERLQSFTTVIEAGVSVDGSAVA